MSETESNVQDEKVNTIFIKLVPIVKDQVNENGTSVCRKVLSFYPPPKGSSRIILLGKFGRTVKYSHCIHENLEESDVEKDLNTDPVPSTSFGHHVKPSTSEVVSHQRRTSINKPLTDQNDEQIIKSSKGVKLKKSSSHFQITSSKLKKGFYCHYCSSYFRLRPKLKLHVRKTHKHEYGYNKLKKSVRNKTKKKQKVKDSNHKDCIRRKKTDNSDSVSAPKRRMYKNHFEEFDVKKLPLNRELKNSCRRKLEEGSEIDKPDRKPQKRIKKCDKESDKDKKRNVRTYPGAKKRIKDNWKVEAIVSNLCKNIIENTESIDCTEIGSNDCKLDCKLDFRKANTTMKNNLNPSPSSSTSSSYSFSHLSFSKNVVQCVQCWGPEFYDENDLR